MNPNDETLLNRRALLARMGMIGAGALALSPRDVLALGNRGITPQMRWPTVAKFLADYVDPRRVSGMVATLGFGTAPADVLARGRLALAASAAPETADSLFRIYSMTKPITGMAAMMLIDEGKLKLDQPLADILPKFATMQVLVNPNAPVDQVRPATAPITIRQLLTHTAGLGYSIIQKGPIKTAYEEAGIVPGRVSRLDAATAVAGRTAGIATAPSLAVFADKLAALPLVFEPGTRWSYSVALDLLGRVIEVVAGQPFDMFLKQRIFDPCGMASTGFIVPARDAARMTTNYGIYKGALVPIDPGRQSVYLTPPAFPFGGAGLVSSPRDYDRFLMMLANGGEIGRTRVMSAAAVAMGTSNLLPPGADTSSGMIRGAGFGAGGRVGLGPDAGTYGWGGAAGTVAFINTRVRLRAGLYTQYMPSEALPIHADFPKAVIADLATQGALKVAA